MITTIDDIKNLIASDESRTLELKKTTGELKDDMHSACAFLNINPPIWKVGDREQNVSWMPVVSKAWKNPYGDGTVAS